MIGNSMLILNRNVGESIHIGDDIRITVLGTQHNQARVGIQAPREIPVHREEIYYREKFSQGQELASAGVSNDVEDFVVEDDDPDAVGNR